MNELKTDVTNFNAHILIRTDLRNLSTVERLVFDKLEDNQDLSIDSFSDVVSFANHSLKSYQTPIYGLVIFIALFGIIDLINRPTVSRGRYFPKSAFFSGAASSGGRLAFHSPSRAMIWSFISRAFYPC